MSGWRGAARRLFSGANQYLGTVVIGVLFAPVLPDVAVELFGGSDQRWVDPLLRLAALGLVFALCVGVYQLQLSWTQWRVGRSGLVLVGVEQRDVLVLPVGLPTTYRSRGSRMGEISVAEWLVDSARPQLVIAVGSPQVAERMTGMGEQLNADGVAFESIVLRDVYDPEIAVPDAERLVIGLMTANGVLDRSCYVDTTSGTVPMSIAMLRVGSLLGAQCTYISSTYCGREVVPGSQRGRAFDVSGLLTPLP